MMTISENILLEGAAYGLDSGGLTLFLSTGLLWGTLDL
jgi:hypothetical protein